MEIQRALSRALVLLSIMLPMAASGAGIPQRGGLWTGSTTLPWSAGKVSAFVLLGGNHRAYLALGNIMLSGDVLLGQESPGILFLAGNIQRSEPIQGKAPPPAGFVNQTRRSIYADLVPRWKLNGNWCANTSCTISPSLLLPYRSSYNTKSSLALVAGTYREAHAKVSGVLSVASNGDLFLQDPNSGCIFNGHVVLIDANYNSYNVDFSYASCTKNRALNGATFSGLATYDASVSQLVVLGMVTQAKAGSNVHIANVYNFARQ